MHSSFFPQCIFLGFTIRYRPDRIFPLPFRQRGCKFSRENEGAEAKFCEPGKVIKYNQNVSTKMLPYHKKTETSGILTNSANTYQPNLVQPGPNGGGGFTKESGPGLILGGVILVAQGASPDISLITCCDHGYGRPSWRPRVSAPAAYRSGTPRNHHPPVARWHAHLRGLAAAIHEISRLEEARHKCQEIERF